MKISTDHILTTHVGSLPRSQALEAKIAAKENDTLDAEGQAALPQEVADAVKAVVKRQADLGISVVDDGEMSKCAYATYARERLTGLTGVDQPLALSELAEFPEFAKNIVLDIKTPACVGPITYHGDAILHVASMVTAFFAQILVVAEVTNLDTIRSRFCARAPRP